MLLDGFAVDQRTQKPQPMLPKRLKKKHKHAKKNAAKGTIVAVRCCAGCPAAKAGYPAAAK